MENKFARFMRNTGPARFLIPAGIILIICKRQLKRNDLVKQFFSGTDGRVFPLKIHKQFCTPHDICFQDQQGPYLFSGAA